MKYALFFIWLAWPFRVELHEQMFRDMQAAHVREGRAPSGGPAIPTRVLWLTNDGAWDRRLRCCHVN